MMADFTELTEHHRRRYGRQDSVPADPTRCANRVYGESRFPSFRQCRRKRVKGTTDDAFCRQHDPVAVNAKREAERARWEAQDAARERKRKRRDLEIEATVLLRQIAHGHNDPRGLASEWLVKWDEQQEPGTAADAMLAERGKS